MCFSRVFSWVYCLTMSVSVICLPDLETPVLAQDASNDGEWLRAPAIKPGDTIAFVCPASPPSEMTHVYEYARHLESMGFKVTVSSELLTRSTKYLAGSDTQRAEELNAAIRDPNVRAIFPIRGGYGLTRILDRLDYDALRADPKIVTGYSDVTALHLAIARKSRLVTFHSPMPLSSLWKGADPEFGFAARSFDSVIFKINSADVISGNGLALPECRTPKTLVGGSVKGRLVGGNLTLICTTLATPYSVETDGRILFIEEVNEAPYRVDRLLSQLRLAGVLKRASGVVVGDISSSNVEDEPQIRHLIEEYFSELGVPVLTDFPVGHIANNTTLPHGGLIELDADLCKVRLLEDPILR